MLEINKTITDDTLTVCLDGKMDTTTSPEVMASVEGDTDKVTNLVFDLKNLKYLSSAGLRVLLSLHKKMQAKGTMKLINVNETIMEIFSLTGFLEFLNIE